MNIKTLFKILLLFFSAMDLVVAEVMMMRKKKYILYRLKKSITKFHY